jgi:hypothetical protein
MSVVVLEAQIRALQTGHTRLWRLAGYTVHRPHVVSGRDLRLFTDLALSAHQGPVAVVFRSELIAYGQSAEVRSRPVPTRPLKSG